MSEDRLAAARVAALFNVARPAYFASVANAGLLLVAVWEALPPALLLAWFGALAALTLGRTGLQRSYRRNAGARAPGRWESLFVLGAFAAGALWAYPAAVFLPVIEPLLQLAVVFVLGGCIIGAAGVYAASPAAFYGFSALPFLAVVLQLAQQGGRTYALLALMVAVFGAAMARVYYEIHASIVSALRTRIENESLVERLAGQRSATAHGGRRRGRQGRRAAARAGSLRPARRRGKTDARHPAGGHRVLFRPDHRALQPASGTDARLRPGGAAGPVFAHAVSVGGALERGRGTLQAAGGRAGARRRIQAQAQGRQRALLPGGRPCRQPGVAAGLGDRHLQRHQRAARCRAGRCARARRCTATWSRPRTT
ncbi:MAG: hypothetical protein WDO13_20510 [Verrucomicrobiota bacterium]